MIRLQVTEMHLPKLFSHIDDNCVDKENSVLVCIHNCGHAVSAVHVIHLCMSNVDKLCKK